VGLHKPFASATLVGLGAIALSGCDNKLTRIAMPHPLSSRGTSILHLWQGAWIAALITGAITWALIFFAMWRYRRRSEDEIPVQTRYNLPLEIFYTIAPVFMVIVFFAWTVKAQDAVLEKPNVDQLQSQKAYTTIEVTGQQWSWTFNYGVGAFTNNDGGKNPVEINQGIADYYRSVEEHAADPSVAVKPYPFDYAQYAYLAGDGSNIPVLVVPQGETVRFNLHSPDVIHDFGVPDFLEKMDVVPGRVNHYWVTPNTITAAVDVNSPDNNFLVPAGAYNNNESDTAHYYLRDGACYELCGTYHSRMLFKVAIVSPADYQKYIELLAKRGQITAAEAGPQIGGMDAVIASTGVEESK
jgi:cytochrome c oxidase subunit 2